MGSTVMVQTQSGPTKGRWETSGIVVDVLEHNSYLVKMDRCGTWVAQQEKEFFPEAHYGPQGPLGLEAEQ